MEFERGKTIKKLEVIGKAKGTGTLITFKPDPEIFRETIEFKSDRITPAPARTGLPEFRPGNHFPRRTPGRRRSRRAFTTRTASRNSSSSSTRARTPLHPKPIAFRKETKEKLDDKDIEVHVEVVLQYNDSYNDQVLCYTNTIHNPDGGTHLIGLPQRADARDQSVREVEQSAEGKGPADHRRRRARRLDGGDLGQAQRSEVRIADQGEAAFTRSRKHRRLGHLRRADDAISTRTRPSRNASWTRG